MWPFSKREDRALPPGAAITYPGGSGAPTWALESGSTVDTDAALRLSAVWACVRLLADTVSTLPVDVYRRGRPDPMALPALLVEPAAGQPLHEWLYSVMTSLVLRGNAYGLITARSGATLLPAQVELVHPDLVTVHQDIETGLITYRIGGRPFTRDDVWHVRAYTLPGVALGMSPIEYARQAIALGLAAEKFGGQFFGDGAMPTGILHTEQTMTRDQAENASHSWHAAHRNRHQIAVISGMKFQPITVPPEESQFIETQRFTVEQIARVFGVPPEMVGASGGDSMTYSNIVDRDLTMLKYTISPWLVRLETALSRLIPRQQQVRFNVDALLRASTKARYDAYAVGLANGFLSTEEIRTWEGLPPLPPATPPTEGNVA